MKRDYIKRLVSTATSIVMIFSCLTGMITASAETQYTVSETISATLSDVGVLTITGTGEIPNYNATSKPWNSVATSITSVVINSGITSIGNMSFTNCRNITSISVAETVKSLGSAAFGNCNKANLVIDIKGTITTCQTNTFQGVTGKVNVYDQATYDLLELRGVKNLVLNVDTDSLKADLQKLINDTKQKYKQEDYTEASYKALSDALTLAETVVGKDSPTTEEIQNATKAINDAIGKLVSVIDGLKNELNTLIEEAKNKISTTQMRNQYTTSSLTALDKAIEDAEATVVKPEVTKEELTQSKTAIETASKVDETGLAETGLKVKASLDGLSELSEAISKAKQSGEVYTEESYAGYRKVVDKLLELNGKTDDITDQQIDAVIAELKAAEEQLVEEKYELNLEAYKAAKKAIENILNAQNSPYTEKSLRGATNSLTSIYNFQLSFVEDKSGKINNGVLQSRIDQVTKTLEDVINPSSDNYVLVEKGDVTPLKALVESAKQLVESNYTAETWKILIDKLVEAEALINDSDNAAKSDVEATEQALKNAINALKLKPSSSSQKPGPSTSTKNPGTVSGTPGKTSAKTVKSASQLKAEKAMNQAKITKLTVKSKAKKTIVVKWNKVKNAKGYQVQVSTKKTFKKLIINKKSVKKNKITIKNKKLKKVKKYFVRVRAYATYKDSKGVMKKAYSSWNKKLRTVKIK